MATERSSRSDPTCAAAGDRFRPRARVSERGAGQSVSCSGRPAAGECLGDAVITRPAVNGASASPQFRSRVRRRPSMSETATPPARRGPWADQTRSPGREVGPSALANCRRCNGKHNGIRRNRYVVGAHRRLSHVATRQSTHQTPHTRRTVRRVPGPAPAPGNTGLSSDPGGSCRAGLPALHMLRSGSPVRLLLVVSGWPDDPGAGAGQPGARCAVLGIQ